MSSKLIELQGKGRITISRDDSGVPHISADHEADLYFGLGYCHALDRGLQLLLTRILGRGQAAEFLDGSDEMVKIDKFFRRMNWGGETAHHTENLTPDARAACEAYCSGINLRFSKAIPLELRLLGYQPDPWTIDDCLMLTRIIGYISMAQCQGDIEKFLIEMIQGGVSRTKLDELFPGLLGGLDEELVKKIKVHESIVPSEVIWNSALPRMMASNNWVVAGSRTESGKPFLANDPHLEVNRLPNVWYEAVLKSGSSYIMGSSMPGIPAILIGRNNHTSWGATYTFMDSIDSWIEECRNGEYRVDENGLPTWKKFKVRKEVIKRKKKSPIQLTLYENHHGLLDGSPEVDGHYLATRWSSAVTGAQSLNEMIQMFHVQNVAEGMSKLGRLELAFNWVLADTAGNIGYQMSGLMPKRRAGVSGLVPLPGWEKQNDWQGLVAPEDLPRTLNPPEGFIATANNDLNHLGKEKPINACMGSYRVDRITRMIQAKHKLALKDHIDIHYDVFSVQAELFMKHFLPLLPESKQGQILKDWDLRYDEKSEGAFLFEKIYRELYRSVFGRQNYGLPVNDYLATETGIYNDFFSFFDRILLSETSEWFSGKSRQALYQEAIDQALQVQPEIWGSVQKIIMANIFLGKKLPLFFGFDVGPITIPGGRATVSQGQLIKMGGRMTSFIPAVRILADMSMDHLRTNIAGGVSDRRFSRWYTSDLKNWLTRKYKVLKP